MLKHLSFRTWATIITLALLLVVIYLGWPEISRGFSLLLKINSWVLILLIPIQIVSYYAVGQSIFSYLRSKGDLKDISRWRMTRMALEMNFVNHVSPVSGVSSFPYLSWLLKRDGVGVGRSTMAQMIRIVTTFASFVCLMLISLFVLSFDNAANRTVIFICTTFVVAMIGAIVFMVYVIENRSRIVSMSNWLSRNLNKIAKKVTHGKKTQLVDPAKLEEIFLDFHQDYLDIRENKKILIEPFLWSTLGNVLDVCMTLIAFIALGFWISPATLVIGYGLSSFMGNFAATPGGAGIYETVMIAFLASAGISADIAIAGTLLARVILLCGTLLFGYIFYQLTLNKYGKTDI